MRPDAERVASLVNLDAKAVCSDLTALQNWIGVVQYYSRFIPRSALILGPMQEQLNDKCRDSRLVSIVVSDLENVLVEPGEVGACHLPRCQLQPVPYGQRRSLVWWSVRGPDASGPAFNFERVSIWSDVCSLY